MSLAYGLAYGAAWWLLGPLTLMPAMMGNGARRPLERRGRRRDVARPRQ